MSERVFTNCTNVGPVSVYVGDGGVVRIRPLVADEDEFRPWAIEAEANVLPADEVQPCAHGARGAPAALFRRPHSVPDEAGRLRPERERNPENRGMSPYERISWDEALDIVSGEIARVKKTHGGSAISGITSSHHNWGIVGYKMGPFCRFMNMLEYTPVFDNPDSWEGWHWGATHTYGFYWRLGMPEQYDILEDALKNTEMIVFWSNDPDTTRAIYSAQDVGHLAAVAQGKGGQDGLHRSLLQLHNAP